MRALLQAFSAFKEQANYVALTWAASTAGETSSLLAGSQQWLSCTSCTSYDCPKHHSTPVMGRPFICPYLSV